MGKQILVRKAQLRGGDRMVPATILAERGDTLRVVLEGTNKPVMVNRRDTHPAPDRSRGPVASALPDARNSLYGILKQRGF